MARCSFCSREISAGTGKMFVATDCRIFHFCSSKCEKNMLSLNRKARSLKWAKERE